MGPDLFAKMNKNMNENGNTEECKYIYVYFSLNSIIFICTIYTMREVSHGIA